jgi:hypothetical protein
MEAKVEKMDVAALPKDFKEVRLELGREEEHPNGDPDRGYIMIIPLDADGRLEGDLAALHRESCRAVKFVKGRKNEHGILRRRRGGVWAIHYSTPNQADEDEAGYRLSDHRFVAGEYVTMEEDDGPHTYRVATVAKPHR